MSHPRSRSVLFARPRRATLAIAAVGAIALCTLGALGPARAAEPAPSTNSDTTTVRPGSLASAVTTPVGVIQDQAEDALASARAALGTATALDADVTASALDLGGDATIDTAVLQSAVDALDTDDFEISPVLFLPQLTEDVLAATTDVAAETEDVSTRLEAAKQAEAERKAREEAERKAAEEAAKKAAEEAAAKAEAEAEAQRRSGGGSGSGASNAPAPQYSGGGSGDNSPSGAKATAREMVAARGWGEDEFRCLELLWNRESGWNYQAYNGGSGAFGIPQSLPGNKMASAGADWQTNAATQITWGLGYISGRYGTPCGAWAHSENNGWY